ncbi:hypothetical protein L9G74_21330, partial [Shewanella sp. C32]
DCLRVERAEGAATVGWRPGDQVGEIGGAIVVIGGWRSEPHLKERDREPDRDNGTSGDERDGSLVRSTRRRSASDAAHHDTVSAHF